MSGRYDVAAFFAPDPVLIAVFQGHLNPYPVQSVLISNTYLSHKNNTVVKLIYSPGHHSVMLLSKMAA